MMKKFFVSIVFLCFLSVIVSCNTNTKQTKENTQIEKQQFEFDKQFTLTGTVQLIPNESETEMKSYVLVLDKPIDIVSKSKDFESQSGVSEMLLAFADEKLDLASFMDKIITVTGTLTASQSFHEKRPVGMFDAKIN